MTAASPKVEIDWAGNGAFTDANSDVTNYVMTRTGVGFSRGLDQQRGFWPPVAGLSTFELYNQSKFLSPGYSSSPIFGSVLPGRKVRITTTSPARTLWTGYTDEIVQHPEWGKRSVDFSCLGVYSRLAGKSVSTPVYQSIRVDQAIGYLLDAIGWSLSERTLNAATVTLDSWWLDNEDAATALLSLVATEGPYARIYESSTGYLVFESNATRSIQARSTSSQATWADTSTNIAFTYDPNYKDVVARVRVTQIERQLQALAPIWTYGSALTLAANETKKFEIKTTDPFINAQVPSPAPSNAAQALTPSAALTSGTFKLKFRDQTTSSLNYNSSAATIQSALEALSSIGSGNVLCQGSLTTGILVSFVGTLGGQEISDLIEIVSNALNPVTVDATVEASPVRDGGENPPGSGITYVEVQALAPSGTLTAGSFTVSVAATGASGSTASIAYNDTAATIQTRIRAITGFSSTLCYGGPINTTPVTVVFSYSEDMDLMGVSGSGLTATVASATLTITQSNKGGVPDFVLTAGSLASKSLDRTSGASARLTLVAGASGVTLLGLQVRAQLLAVLNTNYVAVPTDDVTDPQGLIYSPAIRAEVALATVESLVADIYDRHNSAIPSVNVSIFTPMSNATSVDGIFAREISDRVTIVDAQSGINQDFFIEHIYHEIQPKDGLVKSLFSCAAVDDQVIVRNAKKYRALITQSSTSAPVANVLENTLASTFIAWSRSAAGRYVGTLAGAFPLATTWIYINSVRDGNSANVVAAYRIDDDTIALHTGAQNGSYADSVLSSRPVDFEIIVYSEPFASLRDVGLYRALLTQAGDKAPDATVIDNNFPGGLTWAYDSIGDFFATTPDGFNASDCLIFCNSIREANSQDQASVALSDRLYLNTGTANLGTDSGTFASSILTPRGMDIQVWQAPGDYSDSLFGDATKIYRALISQQGTHDPEVVNELGNTLGGTPVFTRISAGQYTITLTSAFPNNFTFVKINGIRTIEGGDRVACYRVDSDTLALKSGTPNAGYLDSIIGIDGISLEVLVYPNV